MFTKGIHRVLKTSKKPVLLYFWATWCTDCHRFQPLLDTLIESYKSQITFLKINTEEYSEIAETFTVMSIPTLLLLIQSKPTVRIVENFNMYEIQSLIDKYIEKGGEIHE